MGIHIRTALKYVLVAVLSFPVAVFFIGDVALCIGEKELPFMDQITALTLLALLLIWGIVTYWATRVPSTREAAARTCRAFALAAILLPVASIVFWVTEPYAPDPIFPPWFITLVCLIFGGIMSVLGWVASLHLSPDTGRASEKDSFRPRRRTL
ncbi:MAG: hypothetical protein OXK79_10265 [Chloroflexota bacterium]|nr:hypothetical protein [Chloroflexota bacterium]